MFLDEYRIEYLVRSKPHFKWYILEEGCKAASHRRNDVVESSSNHTRIVTLRSGTSTLE